MRAIRSDVLGFCGGVSRAVKGALDALGSAQASRKPKKIYSLGPLIHNAAALERLKEKGLLLLDEGAIDSLDKDCAVVVRAHGLSPFVLERIKKTGAAVIDATCPRVALSQRRAAEAARKGMFVILAGDAGHAEVKAVEGSALFARMGGEKIAGEKKDGADENSFLRKVGGAEIGSAENISPANSAGGNETDGLFVLVQSACGAERLLADERMDNNALLLSQTTFSPEEFEKIEAALRKKIKGLEVFNSICPATGERQAALVRLSKKADALVVVGGKKSANSARLYEFAKSLCPASYFVEGADDVPRDFGGARVAGICAGASVPDFVIDQVEEKILNG